MSKREEMIVPQGEIERQMEFMRLIREHHEGGIKKYYLGTFGCQMNENDSERLAGMLFQMGYEPSQKAEDSHLIILNTCCVRENAEMKVYGHLGIYKKFKEKNPNILIAVCGCMMQQKDVVDKIKKSYRHVNVIFGTHNLYKFPEQIYQAMHTRKMVIDVKDIEGSLAEGLPIERKEGVKAFVTVMYGCNNFCSYCIVPYVRGRERSRDIEDILKEIRILGATGYKEITLLGQNVNSYGKDLNESTDFANLLYKINDIQGIERIRFMTSHPKDLSERLIEAMKHCKKVCEHLHLPIQSGSSDILKKMNRSYTKEQYLALVEKVRAQIPKISLTTDIIVGFPGETTADFDETLDVLACVQFDQAYTFLYSKRTGTPAAKYIEQVTEETKKERFEKMLTLQNSISNQLNVDLLGEELEVLVEGFSKTSHETYTGRTRSNKIVNFAGKDGWIGKLVLVKIERIQTWSLEGSVVKILEDEASL